MTGEAAFEMLASSLTETFGIDRAQITPDARLVEDLDLDSIDAVDLAVRLQKLTGKRLGAETFKRLRTVRDVVDAIVQLDQG